MKNSTEIIFDKEMANKPNKGFLLTAKFYKSADDPALLDPEKRKLKGTTSLHLEDTSIKKQNNMTTKQTVKQKIHANDLHVKLDHTGEYRICVTAKHLQYSVKRMLEVCEDCATTKSKQKLLHNVTEEHDLKPGKLIYLDLSS